MGVILNHEVSIYWRVGFNKHASDQGGFRPIHGRIAPFRRDEVVVRGVLIDLQGVVPGSVFLIGDDGPARFTSERARFQTNLPVAGIGGEESHMGAQVACLLDMAAHVPTPIFIMSDREEGLMGCQERRVGMDIDIRGIGYVIPFPLQPTDHIIFPACC